MTRIIDEFSWQAAARGVLPPLFGRPGAYAIRVPGGRAGGGPGREHAAAGTGRGGGRWRRLRRLARRPMFGEAMVRLNSGSARRLTPATLNCGAAQRGPAPNGQPPDCVAAGAWVSAERASV